LKGLRKHSAEYVLGLMELLKEKYNVGYFTFGDESFVSSKKWTLDFLKKMQRRGLDVLFYVLGARVDTVDKELLMALKESGCFMIEYGFESGSQRMLDMMEKRTTVAENYKVYWMTREAGIHTVPANVINMPGETPETIQKTIEFLKSLKMDPPQYFVNYVQAVPGTPLYEYALLTGLIEDEDLYLSGMTDVNPGKYREAFRNGVFLNFSGQPLSEVLSWHRRITSELEMDYAKRQKGSFLLNLVRLAVIPKILKAFTKMKREGLSKIIRYYYHYPAIKHSLKAYFRQTRQKKYSNKSGSESAEYIDQLGLKDKELIEKIRKGKYVSRDIVKNPLNKHIDTYIDRMNGYSLIRYPSLRKACRDIIASGVQHVRHYQNMSSIDSHTRSVNASEDNIT